MYSKFPPGKTKFHVIKLLLSPPWKTKFRVGLLKITSSSCSLKAKKLRRCFMMKHWHSVLAFPGPEGKYILFLVHDTLAQFPSISQIRPLMIRVV